ncbi:MAG: ribbon-helix-helix domain-containing protein [Candidatus Accumulibacter sp. UW26]|jgi:metal-responsive CopG/Arc/MetJ family transcriptional regulator
MPTKGKRSAAAQSERKTARASVSFPLELYETRERIAKEKKVSVAWIVRDAAEQYVGQQWPLFTEEKGTPHA